MIYYKLVPILNLSIALKMTLHNDSSLVDLASDNQDLKHKMAILLTNIELIEISDLENQISTLIKNMMNFFSLQVEEIPSFDLLPIEQQQILLKKFKKIAHSLKKKKAKSIDEVIQIFLFTILSNIGSKGEILEDEELVNKKSKHSFKSFLRKAAEHEIYTIINENQVTDINKEKDFIHNSVLLGVKKAMQKIGLDLSTNSMDEISTSILEETHKKFQYNKSTRSLI